MSKVTLNWGILGPGKIANEFAADFQYVSNSQVVAVASRSVERATAFAEEFNIEKAYSNYQDLYSDPNVDIIYIATPHNYHFEQSLAALEAGKSVLCEKPIVTKISDLEVLIRKAREKGLFLMEGMWMYFHPAINKAKEWVDDGRIGTIKSIMSDFGFNVPFDPTSRMYNPDLAGGTLLDMGIYPVAIANLFLGAEPEKVHVSMRKAETGVDSDVVAILDYGVANATLHSSFDSRLPNLTQIIGEKGTVVIPDCWGAKEASLVVEGEVIERYLDQSEGRGFRHEIQSVTEDVLAGKVIPSVMEHDQSLRLQNIMELISNQY